MSSQTINKSLINETNVASLGFQKKYDFEPHLGGSMWNHGGWYIWWHERVNSEKGAKFTAYIRNASWPQERPEKYWSFCIETLRDAEDWINGRRTYARETTPVACRIRKRKLESSDIEGNVIFCLREQDEPSWNIYTATNWRQSKSQTSIRYAFDCDLDLLQHLFGQDYNYVQYTDGADVVQLKACDLVSAHNRNFVFELIEWLPKMTDKCRVLRCLRAELSGGEGKEEYAKLPAKYSLVVEQCEREETLILPKEDVMRILSQRLSGMAWPVKIGLPEAGYLWT